MVMDANVLYWIFYRNFSSLSYAGGRHPSSYQLTNYRNYWRRGTNAKTRFQVVAATLGEFAKTAEYAELETIWNTDPVRPQPDPNNPVTQFDPRVCKFARYHYSRRLGSVRRAIEGMIVSLRNLVHCLPLFPTSNDLHAESMIDWQGSCGDFPDAMIIASAKRHSKANILSDDMDIATFPGITLYTANRNTIRAASAAGKLR